MNKKFPLGVMISLIAIACAVTFVLTMTVSLNMFNSKIAGVSEREEIYTKIQEIDTYVRNSTISAIDEDKLKTSIVSGYISGLGDENAAYLNADEYYRRQQIESGIYVSTGIEAEKEESGYIKVSYIYAGSSASTAGIYVGDVINSVGGKNVLEIGADEAIKMLEGEENVKTDLTVQRNGVEVPIGVTCTSFTIKAVSYSVLNNIGYIRINTFNSLTASQFDTVVQSLQAQEVSGYVIDVRSSDGLYTPLSQMLEHFVSAAVLANASYKDDTVKKLLETTAAADILSPLAVLVDENTSGAAELFSLSLRDYAGAKLVGIQTAGVSELTETKGFSDGSALVLTVARIVPTITADYGDGIKPDFSVDLGGSFSTNPENLDTQSDAQLKKAFEVMETLK